MKEYPALKLLLSVLLFFFIFYNLLIPKNLILYLIPIIFILVVVLSYFKKYNISYILLSVTISLLILFNIRNNEITFPKKIIPDELAIFTGKIERIGITKLGNNIFLICNGTLDSKSLPELNNIRIKIRIRELEKIKVKLEEGSTIRTFLKINFPKPKFISTDLDEYQYLKLSNLDFLSTTEADKIIILKEPNLFHQKLNNFKKIIIDRIHNLFSEKYFALVIAILLGEKGFLDYELRNEFSKTGTAHLLALSGLHVGVISILIYLMLGFINIRWIKLMLFVLILIFYNLLIGFYPSSVRASLMSIIAVFGILQERQIHPLNSLSLAAIIMIMFDNNLILNPGFQMSIFSVLGILIFYKIIFDKLKLIFKNNNLNFILNSISITLAASLTVSPIVSYYFKIFSIISPLSNLFEIPLVSLILIGSIITLFTSFILLNLAFYFSLTVEFLIDILFNINSYFANFKFSFISGDDTILVSLFFSVLVLLILYSNNIKLMFFRIIYSTIFFIFAINYFYPKNTNNDIYIINKNYVMLITDTASKINNYVIIFDRKPGLNAFEDKYINYIVNNYDSIKLFYCGNYGLLLDEQFKKNNKYLSIKQLSPDYSDTLSKYLGLKDNFFQLVDYK